MTFLPKWKYPARKHLVEYMAWKNAKNRCCKTEIHNYENYGGRGIYMCDKWLNDFDAFYEDMGPKPEGYSLERVDVNGPYSPENCIWFPLKEQQKNTTETVYITYHGVTRSSHEWAKLTGIRERLIRQRHNRGHTPEAILHNGPLKYGNQVNSCWGGSKGGTL